MSFDLIVVGAGSAGCVLAARLSAAGRRVLLIEAGPDHPSAADLPADVADASEPTLGHDWGFAAEPDGERGPVPLPRARLVGGCSATNGTFFVRGWPADYDAWAAAGNDGWSFAELLPFFRAVESDGDGDEWHGGQGPIPVVRTPRDALEPWPRAFLDAAVAAGHPPVADHNRPGALGVGPLPRNVRDGTRMSTALTYLAPARSRPTLELRAGALVDRVVLVHGRARGVQLAGGEVVEADGVVLAAGAYGSPAILLRSGIGPAGHLRALGLPVIADRAGVGANLVDHPLVAVDLPATPGRRGPAFSVLLTMRSSLTPPADPPDLHVFLAGPFDDPSVPSGAVAGIVTGLLSPRSRGSLRLRSADPAEPPLIDPAYLRHPDDMTRMVEATREARRIGRTTPLVELVPGPEIAPGEAVCDDAGLARSIRGRVTPYHHPVGTCAMGPDPGGPAVVDARGSVHGVDQLWVADASVMADLTARPRHPERAEQTPTVTPGPVDLGCGGYAGGRRSGSPAAAEVAGRSAGLECQ